MADEKLKFLIVEDDESQRMLLKAILKKQYNCGIIEKENGQEALEYLKTEIPTLILMDLNMPVLDGPELLKIFQANSIYKKIPVIVISANNDKNIIGSLVNKGIYDYILKPIELNSTISRIRKVLSKTFEGMDASKNSAHHKLAKLLLVEPDKFQRELITKLIGNHFTIHEAKNGTEALSAFEKHKHRYILLSDKAELLDKKIVTQKVRELAQENDLSIFLLHTDEKTISTKIFNFDGLIKRSIDVNLFRNDLLTTLEVSLESSSNS